MTDDDQTFLWGTNDVPCAGVCRYCKCDTENELTTVCNSCWRLSGGEGQVFD